MLMNTIGKLYKVAIGTVIVFCSANFNLFVIFGNESEFIVWMEALVNLLKLIKGMENKIIGTENKRNLGNIIDIREHNSFVKSRFRQFKIVFL